MENLSGSWFEGISNAVRKKRRTLGRRPRETQSYVMTPPDRYLSPLASPFDETAEHGYERSRNHVRDEGAYASRQNVLALPSSRMSLNGSKGMKIGGEAQSVSGHLGVENDKKLKRVKIKVQGKTAFKDRLNGDFATDDSSLKGVRTDQKDIVKDAHTYPLNTGSGLKGNPLKDFSTGRNDCSMGRPGKSKPSKQVEKLENVRKSKRAPNRRVLDPALEDDEVDDEVDDEIKFLEKLRNSRSSIGHNEDDDESSRKRQKYSRGSEISVVAGNCCEASENEDQDASPTTVKDNDTSADLKRNTTLTARQRALLSGRGGPSLPDANLEFPNGLEEAPSKNKKDNLSEKELLKKAEAAQKRRLHNEKVAQKSQEEAIRKILSQDSSKKKKEDRNRKRLEELAEVKAAEAIKHQSNTVRVVMAPTGTIVSFGENCIPSIFTAKPSSYPPPRESCSGPSCNNPYKYRDSKSKLPLCSLKCYKEVRESRCQDYISSSSN